MITSGPIVLEPHLNGRILSQDLPVYYNGVQLTRIPKGFVSDGMSFPWWIKLTWDDRWHSRYVLGALLHDWLLTQNMPKWQADWLFYGALRSQGVSALEAFLFFCAVRTKRGSR